MAKQGGLGRGLGALIVKTDDDQHGAVPAASAKANASAGFNAKGTAIDQLGATDQEHVSALPAGENGVREIAVNTIAPNPHQPRSLFDPEALEELAASIREHGIIQLYEKSIHHCRSISFKFRCNRTIR